MIRKSVLMMCLSIAPVAAFGAEILPSAYQVRGVAQDDVLNIRAAPSASAATMGQIGAFALNVEVIEMSPDGKWGKVGIPEGNGWVSMRYLEVIPAEDDDIVPRPLSCFGTEPFWNIGLFPRGAEYNSPDTGAVPMSVVAESVAPQGYLVQLEEGPSLTRTLIISREKCSDGMSDREYGFSARMFLEARDGNGVYSACCTQDHR